MIRHSQLEKRLDWFRAYDFDFEDYAEFKETPAQVLNAVVYLTATPAGLTLGAPVISGFRVQVPISGGTLGVNYQLDCEVNTSLGAILSMRGFLLVLH